MYAVYCLYASAAALRDRTAVHASLGDSGGMFPAAGVVAAGFGALGLFFIPWMARNWGYPGAAIALLGVTVAMAAAALASRTWALTRLTGAIGIGELILRHYGVSVAALIGIVINSTALVLVGLMIHVIGVVVVAISNGGVPPAAAPWLAALFVALTAAPAGLRASGRMAALHAALVLIGAAAGLGGLAIYMGGIDVTVEALARVGNVRDWGTTGGRGGGDYNAGLAIAGAQQTILLLLSHLALAGAVMALVWLPWAAALPDPRPLNRIHLWGASALGGALMIAFAFVWGLAPAAGGDILDTFLRLARDSQGMAAAAGFGGLAAAHALAIAVISGAVVATRPLWSSRRERDTARRSLAIAQTHAIAIVAVAALFVTNVDPKEIAPWLNTVASLAALTSIPIVCACWFPRATTASIFAGLLIGAVVEIAVSPLLTVPAALASVVLATLVRRRDRRLAYRLDVQRQLAAIVGRPGDERGRTAIAWVAVLAWTFFAIGPGVVVGNDVFGDPGIRSTWKFPLPSIAVWQLIAWASGTAVVWFLVRSPGLGPLTRDQLDRLTESPQTDRPAADR